MLVEKSMKDALIDYLNGKKVIVVNELDDESMGVQHIEEMLPPEFHYLVDVPAVMPTPEQIIGVVHDTQKEYQVKRRDEQWR